jgi:hypothetical protein
MSEPVPKDNATPHAGAAPTPRRRIGFWIAVAALVALWTVAMVFRWEIRAHWWVYRLAHAESSQKRDYYQACLASIAPRGADAPCNLIHHPDKDVRLRAVALLRRYAEAMGSGPSTPVKCLHAMRADPDQDVRNAVAIALAFAAGPDHPDTDSLVHALESAPEPAAAAAAFALERVGTPDAIVALLDAAADESRPAVRAQAIDSLGVLRADAAVPVLIEALDDDRPVPFPSGADRALQKALEALGSQPAPAALKQGFTPGAIEIEPAPETISQTAARALARITGESLDFDVDAPPDRRAAVKRMYQHWWEQRKRT